MPLGLALILPALAAAQDGQAPAAPTPAAATAAATTPDPAPEPPPAAAELNLINLPTTTSLNRHQSYFRLTHRFARDLRRGDLGARAEDVLRRVNSAGIGRE